MLLKITESCTMGCTHCINDSKPNGKDMDIDTLNKVLDFLIEEDLYTCLVVSGGEPTEHRDFEGFISHLILRLNEVKVSKVITIATNGEWVIANPQKAKTIRDLGNVYTRVIWQISTDSRYYPRKIDTTKRILREENFYLVTGCVESMTEQGRAKINGLKGDKISSSCFNIRAITRQLYERYGRVSFKEVILMLGLKGKVCTPSIKVDGGIGLGESDLCPTISNVSKGGKGIVEDILNCKCRGCWDINKNLSPEYRRFVE